VHLEPCGQFALAPSTGKPCGHEYLPHIFDVLKHRQIALPHALVYGDIMSKPRHSGTKRRNKWL
jgi:hypothetical protein